MASSTLRPLYPQGKRPWYPLDRRLGGPQSRSGRGGDFIISTLHKYYYGNEMKDDEMVESCSTHEGSEKCIHAT
jgi:hypothetical protein